MTVAEAVRELTEAIKEAQLELPGVSTDDVGKILMVDAEGKWVAILPTAELPDTTGASEGDVLTVGPSEIGWTHPAVELPDATGASEGDVLKVGSSGLEWGEAGGGGGSETIYVALTYDESTNKSTAAISYNDVLTALAAHKQVIFYDDDSEHDYFAEFIVVQAQESSGEYSIAAIGLMPSGEDPYVTYSAANTTDYLVHSWAGN